MYTSTHLSQQVRLTRVEYRFRQVRQPHVPSYIPTNHHTRRPSRRSPRNQKESQARQRLP